MYEVQPGRGKNVIFCICNIWMGPFVNLEAKIGISSMTD